MGMVQEDTILPFIESHLGVPATRLRDGMIDPVAVRLLPRRIAEQLDAIAPITKFHFTIHDSYANGNTCASVARFDTTLPDGSTASTDIVTIHTINDDGQIIQMRAHWEMERTMASLKKP